MKKYLLICLCFTYAYSFAQFVIPNPIVGGMTESSARIYVRTIQPESFTLELSTDPNFGSGSIISLPDSTINAEYRRRIVDVSDLMSETRYYYRFRFGNTVDAIQGSFKTFPVEGQKGYYKIVVGSCNYFQNAPLFSSIQAFEPDLFLHLGDWNWPPSQFGNDMALYPDVMANSFAARYADENMREYVQPYTPVDYIYDDDYSFNDSEGWTYPNHYVEVDSAGNVTNFFETVQMPEGIREGAIQGYFDNFPGYQQVDTSGIHHKFMLGNVEIFMLDERNSRTPRHDAFVYSPTSGLWAYQPPPGHTMLGPMQRDWLLDELQNSDADWKIIGSGVVFNQGYDAILSVSMLIQELPVSLAGVEGSGGTLASNMAYNWVGYPEDQNPLLELYQSGGVRDLVITSGDSHSSVIDDGTNAGIPELNASGLASNDEGYLNYYIDSVGQFLGFDPVSEILWNGGGNGVDNTNFSDTYGTIEIFGDDSLRMCVIDELDQTLGCITLTHSSKVTDIESHIYPGNLFLQALYPNPAKDQLKVMLDPTYRITPSDYLTLKNLSGALVYEAKASDFQENQLVIPLNTFAEGVYLLNYYGERGVESRKIVVQKF